MFKDKYKNAMDDIIPSAESTEKVLNAMNEQSVRIPNSKRIFRKLAIACVSVCIVITSVFAALKIDKIFNHQGESRDESSNLYSENIYSEQNDNKIHLQGLKTAESYDEVLAVLKKLEEANRDWTADLWGDQEIQEEVETIEPDGTDGEITPEHSDTNNQVFGVQEPDIVKNDGKYIYHSHRVFNFVSITKAENGVMQNVAKIEFDSDIEIQEMLLLGDNLAVIGEKQYKDKELHKISTVTLYYDITDRSNPKQTSLHTQDGFYTSARVVDGIVYVISATRSYITGGTVAIDIIPEISGERIAAENIYIPDEISSCDFTVVTAFDVEGEKDEFKSSIAFLGGASQIYSSTENIFITKYNNTNRNSVDDLENSEAKDRYTTSIYKISLNGGNLVTTATGIIDGTVENQFWMDEKDGYLRVASNVRIFEEFTDGQFSYRRLSERYNKVFCLDSNLKVIGESEKLGVDEDIKSVRYIGNVAYVVTFRLTDPLYAIDLTDPTAPKTLSELKIDGFSTYMHPFGNDFLVGIGFSADPETGIQTGIKITMFDITDDKNVFDKSTVNFLWDWEEGVNYYSESTYEHKAVLIDIKKNIIAIPLVKEGMFENEDGEFEWKIKIEFVFFEFDGEKLVQKGSIEFDNEKVYDGNRTLYIGDYGYAVTEEYIVSFSMTEFKVIDSIKFCQ